jgi:ABC-type cobalamin transport system ATPase subunit
MSEDNGPQKDAQNDGLTEGEINAIAWGSGLHVIPPGHSKAIPIAQHVAELEKREAEIEATSQMMVEDDAQRLAEQRARAAKQKNGTEAQPLWGDEDSSDAV